MPAGTHTIVATGAQNELRVAVEIPVSAAALAATGGTGPGPVLGFALAFLILGAVVVLVRRPRKPARYRPATHNSQLMSQISALG